MSISKFWAEVLKRTPSTKHRPAISMVGLLPYLLVTKEANKVDTNPAM
jgi:hypothetical protein